MTRRLEMKFTGEAVQEIFGRAFPDANGAVALHVRVPAHGTRARARSPDLPAQQEKVDDLLNVGDGVHVLR